MDENLKKTLGADPDGLLTYEYIANHIGECDAMMPDLVDNMIQVDTTGQFLVSAARYLSAIDPAAFADSISRLVSTAIERDRERRYIAELLPGLWGPDYRERAAELQRSDDNFRRLYKRVHPAAGI